MKLVSIYIGILIITFIRYINICYQIYSSFIIKSNVCGTASSCWALANSVVHKNTCLNAAQTDVKFMDIGWIEISITFFLAKLFQTVPITFTNLIRKSWKTICQSYSYHISKSTNY